MSTLAWFTFGFGATIGSVIGYAFRAVTHKEVER